MLWEEIKSVLQDYFAEKDKEEIDNPITPLVRLQGSSIETSISTQNQSQTVPTTNVDFQKEKNKYNDIRGSVGIEVFYTLKPISEEVFITGSYTDRYGRNHYEEGIASDKLILTIPIGISYPVTNIFSSDISVAFQFIVIRLLFIMLNIQHLLQVSVTGLTLVSI